MAYARSQSPNAVLTPEGRRRMALLVIVDGWSVAATAERFQVDPFDGAQMGSSIPRVRAGWFVGSVAVAASLPESDVSAASPSGDPATSTATMGCGPDRVSSGGGGFNGPADPRRGRVGSARHR